ncbi:DUF2867 domain-containing protein [Stenotrophomonas sp. 24(2023)]|uniref:DUF2867 domain-containing protein n=1 Tax=Stenotrophomonas sp. 24(2023) TaxID=3068324 RepID=UPI0027DFBA3E|nr:DUF2867 domain-containing protein [Stenotrophomonas sp. 24(2023)]WMJ68247.1 DUF2867 domain-containing protein [Stenotrophomonas sp. 24(2023)]
MPGSTRTRRSFPCLQLPAQAGAGPVEVTLIAQLGIGAGDPLIADAVARQQHHPDFIDALDEPSARLGGMHTDRQDPSSLYSFAVGNDGHPFHRHAGPRMFTAIAGSSGAELRFAMTSDAQLAQDPAAFSRALRRVQIPPDCLFTVRFGGGTWHQFVPRHPGHPALFALSCHSNELAGALSMLQRRQVLDNAADIPSLTQTLPAACQPNQQVLQAAPLVQLSLQATAPSLAGRLCRQARGLGGRLRRWRRGALRGYVERATPAARVLSSRAPAAGMLADALPLCHHDDQATLTFRAGQFDGLRASQVLALILEGFLLNPPGTVGYLMALRNQLVAPLRLRTSPLGCPVSSLLSTDARQHFVGRFPVLSQHTDTSDRHAEVLLGADDRHLRFRSSVSVQLLDDGQVQATLATRVLTLNLFGRLYMQLIDPVHRHHIAPALLRRAAEHAVAPELYTATCERANPAPA